MPDRARFLAAFLKNPFATASVTPSSVYLADAMVQDMEIPKARLVVELGPGTGVFTEAIARGLDPSARLICVEINASLARGVASRFPRATVANDSAENLLQHVGGVAVADCVISGLPWVILGRESQQRLLAPVIAALRSGGLFATFAYSHAAWLPAGRRFRGMLDGAFREVTVSSTVWRNLPPAFVYRCRK